MENESKSLRAFVTMPFVPQGAKASELAKEYPKLTVVTPSYNQVGYLERTILSVLNQNYPNLEYFIIDGGSTDGSVELIRKYEPYLAGWVSERDRGQTDAINKGFRQATGDLLAFQNSDDVFAPGAFEQVAEAWRRNPKAGVFYGDMYMIDEQDVITELFRLPPFCIECHIYEGMQVYNQSLFVQRSLLEQTGFLDETLRFVIDYELVARLGVRPDASFIHVDGFWGGFRVQPDAKSSTIATVGMAEHEGIRRKFAPMLKSRLSESVWLRYCRIRKLLYFVLRGQWGYVRHRLSLRK
ncbi:MAG: glycosyltransferase [Cytophagales bacterium]|nr:MAG: glycosyltransferase [Cytophagales bacterium]